MNDFFARQIWKRECERFSECVRSEAAEGFIEVLLVAMQVAFLLSRSYRENIQNFEGRYQFASQDGQIAVAAIFKNGRMTVVERVIPRPDVTVVFRDSKTLFQFLLSPRQDILGAMLRHDLETDGNLNYIYKLGYMAKQLQQMVPQP